MNIETPRHKKQILIESSLSTATYWKELKEFRELILFLSWRDILIRYKQTAVGILWAIMRPLLLTVALTVVFGQLANFSQQQPIPYPLIVLSGLLPWFFFSNTLSESVEGIIKNQSIISKIYFPRLILPISSMLVTLLDFSVSFVLLILAMLYYQFMPGWHCLLFPCFLSLLFIFSLGANLWISALTVRYRDFRHLIPFVIQFGLYITPVGFVSTIVPEKWQLLYALNPLVGIIDGFRWSLLGTTHFYPAGIAISVIMSLLIFFSGLSFFKRMERTFADII